MSPQVLLAEADLPKLLERLTADYRVLAPTCNPPDEPVFAPFPFPAERLCVARVRTVEPLKAFLFAARQKVVDGFEPPPPGDGAKPVCLVGVKACDLQGLATLDHVFLGDNGDRDPFYARFREQTLLISADCAAPRPTCFCVAYDTEPHPETGFDINLSPVDGGYLVLAGSPRGEQVLAAHAELFGSAGPVEIEAQKSSRTQAQEVVRRNLEEYAVPHHSQLDGAVERAYEAPLWEEEAATCVECGACNTICPTCHCFLLFDQGGKDEFARFRTWDACLLKDFARVAGGGNPRPRLWQRLRNRFEKKFDYFPKVAGHHACTGCGRCIETCPARIDIRRVLRKAIDHVSRA